MWQNKKCDKKNLLKKMWKNLIHQKNKYDKQFNMKRGGGLLFDKRLNVTYSELGQKIRCDKMWNVT